jgi:protein-tyrosine phosphatase
MMSAKIRVLFVCLGNICRSPTAHGIFEQMLHNHPLANRIEVDSAGTGHWHIGSPPDARSIAAARHKGCDISHLRARQVVVEDFDEFDYILAMDASNLKNLMAIKPDHFSGKLCLFLDFAGMSADVPDPYYDDEGFDHVYQLCEQASRGLLQHLLEKHG